MLKLVEQTPTRIVFEERRTGLRAAALICLSMNAFVLFALAIQWRSVSLAYPERVAEPRVVLALAVFVVIILAFSGASVYALLLSRRMTLTFDIEAGDIVHVASRGLKMVTEKMPYYGVKSVRLAGDETLKALALVLVLRDGRVVPITAAPAHDRDKLEALAGQIRSALAGEVPE